jgi:uncharacterized protein (DUF3820 family)
MSKLLDEKMPLGQYKGKTFKDVISLPKNRGLSYLYWLKNKSELELKEDTPLSKILNEQVFNKIVKRYTRMPFGKYANKNLIEIFDDDVQYVEWVDRKLAEEDKEKNEFLLYAINQIQFDD